MSDCDILEAVSAVRRRSRRRQSHYRSSFPLQHPNSTKSLLLPDIPEPTRLLLLYEAPISPEELALRCLDVGRRRVATYRAQSNIAVGLAHRNIAQWSTTPPAGFQPNSLVQSRPGLCRRIFVVWPLTREPGTASIQQDDHNSPQTTASA